MEQVIYSDKGGLGMILNHDEKESDFIIDHPVMINGKELQPGSFTELFGMFLKPVRYVGLAKDELNKMIFHLGNEEDLFNTQKYYSCFYRIAENRIANQYQHGSLRDFLFVKNRWK